MKINTSLSPVLCFQVTFVSSTMWFILLGKFQLGSGTLIYLLIDVGLIFSGVFIT